MMKVSLKE